MKLLNAVVISLVCGFFCGVLVVNLIRWGSINASAYSPDRIVEKILSEGTIVGQNSSILPPAKGRVLTSLNDGGRTYSRRVITNNETYLLLTIENSLIIEVEIWSKLNNGPVFYESDPAALRRYAAARKPKTAEQSVPPKSDRVGG